jgi:hypothetical protein
MLGEVEFEVEKVSMAVREGRREKRGVRKCEKGRGFKKARRAVQVWMDGQKREKKGLAAERPEGFQMSRERDCPANGIAGRQAPAIGRGQNCGTGFCCSNQGSSH